MRPRKISIGRHCGEVIASAVPGDGGGLRLCSSAIRVGARRGAPATHVDVALRASRASSWTDCLRGGIQDMWGLRGIPSGPDSCRRSDAESMSMRWRLPGTSWRPCALVVLASLAVAAVVLTVTPALTRETGPGPSAVTTGTALARLEPIVPIPMRRDWDSRRVAL